MAKDPAVLLYTSDFLTGTFTMTNEEVGMYIKLLCIQHQKKTLSESDILSVCGGVRHPAIFEKFKNDSGNYYNERMRVESEKRKAYSESRSKSRSKSDEDNVRIYIVRDNVRRTYKIGSSVNPLRRYNELANQKNPAIIEDSKGERNLTLIWYSDPVKRTEERRLHTKFGEKSIKGEWFSLNESDLKFIYEKFKGTYVERTNIRTSPRTENENEDINTSLLISVWIEKYILDTEWLSACGKSLSVGIPTVMNLLSRFKDHCAAQKSEQKTESDFRNHFLNWARKQKGNNNSSSGYVSPVFGN